MTATYEDVLQTALDALRGGETLDAVLARFPEHAETLRHDIALAGALGRFANAAPAPATGAQRDAAARLMAQLDAQRANAPSGRPGFFSVPRFAAAAAVLAVVVVAASLLLSGDGTSVQASKIEGVVVENAGDRLTVQTLNALEEVEVPANALVTDAAGGSIALGGIEVGQVVMVDGERRERGFVARRVDRLADSLERWCSDMRRCGVLADGLDRARQACDVRPGACPAIADRLTDLRQRAIAATVLERLRNACRDGGASACRELAMFCREHPDLCPGFVPLLPPSSAPQSDQHSGPAGGACSGACAGDAPPDATPAPASATPSATQAAGDVRPIATVVPATPEPDKAPQRDVAPTLPPPTVRPEPTEAPERDGVPDTTPVATEAGDAPADRPRDHR